MPGDELRLDRSWFSVGTFEDDDATSFWRTRSSGERLAALELLWQITYGYDPMNDKIDRILEVVELHLTT